MNENAVEATEIDLLISQTLGALRGLGLAEHTVWSYSGASGLTRMVW